MTEYPPIGSLFKHKNGCIYRADRLDEPRTNTRRIASQNMVFVDIEDGREWSRPISSWHIGFTPYVRKTP